MGVLSLALTPAMPRTSGDAALRVGVVAALVVDAVVHWRLATGYGVAFPAGIGGDAVFRLEAVAAVLVGVGVAFTGSRVAWASAFLVLTSAAVAVVLYRYVPVPQLGPIPSMYEPIWFLEKTVSAVAEGLGALLAALGFAGSSRRTPWVAHAGR